MGEVIEEREDDAEGFLHSHEAVERPFAVKLADCWPNWGIRGNAAVGYNVLACVVTFCWTVPKEDKAMDSLKRGKLGL